MEQSAAEAASSSSNEPSTPGDRKKTCQPPQGIKKRRRIDCKTDEDAANYFADTYFNRVRNTLSEDGFEKFIKILCDYDANSARDEAELYLAVNGLFEIENHTELAEEFLCFIRPQFAKQISKYEESNGLRKIWSLFNSLDNYHFNKMLNILESLSSNPNVKASDVESSLRPLFKGQSNIVPAICQLFPSAKPHTGDVNEYEKVLDISSDRDMEFEHVYVPRGPADRSCPGQSVCLCACHGFSPKPLCSACNIRFINGRIYVQRGKEIRSARLNFSYGVSTDEMQRKLHPSYYAQLQALVESQPKTSPSKGERKDRKNSQSESSISKAEVKETKVDVGNESVVSKSDTKSSLLKQDKSGKSSCPVAVGTSSGIVNSGQVPPAQQVFYQENDEGYLEFFMEESDKEEAEELDTTLSDNEFVDLHATSSDEQSSPTNRSPSKLNGNQTGGSTKRSKAWSKRNKR